MTCLIAESSVTSSFIAFTLLTTHALYLFREIVRHRTSKRTVLYRAPCGRRLRSLDEVFTFLRITDCKLEIDCFCFDFWVHCFTEFEPAGSSAASR